MAYIRDLIYAVAISSCLCIDWCVAQNAGSVKYIIDSSGKNECKDYTKDFLCDSLAPDICSDPLGKAACPRSCNACFNDACVNDKPCQNNGTCTNAENGYNCSCTEDWLGVNCSDPKPCRTESPCLNGGFCHSSHAEEGGYKCNCFHGYTGKNCETLLDYCSLYNPCEHRGVCNSGESNYTCTCKPGYAGKDCKEWKPCGTLHPCKNNAICENRPDKGDYLCICDDLHIGTNCERLKTACDRFPFDPCHHGQCKSLGDTLYRCECYPGYIGDRCDTDLQTGLPATSHLTVATETIRPTSTSTVTSHPVTVSTRTTPTTFSTTKSTATHPTTPKPTTHTSPTPKTTATPSITYTPSTTTLGVMCNHGFCHNGGSCLPRGKAGVCACTPDFSGTYCLEHICRHVGIKELGCSGQQDIIILFPRHIHPENGDFLGVLNFTKSLITHIQKHNPHEAIHIGLGSLAQNARIIHNLTGDLAAVLNRIETAYEHFRITPLPAEEIHLGEALRHASEILRSGGRATAQKVVLVILDDTKDKKASLDPVTEFMKQNCISLNIAPLYYIDMKAAGGTTPSPTGAFATFAGIKTFYNSDELHSVASSFGNLDDHYKSFAGTKDLLQHVPFFWSGQNC